MHNINLGNSYLFGSGVETSPAAAANWYQKSAEQGHPDAQLNLGLCYKNGDGVAKNLETASYWFQKAAEQGDADAQYNLGTYYNDKDHTKAAYWFQKAAEQGHSIAQYSIGNYCEFGTGISKDAHKALFWYEKAAKQGNVEAMTRLAYAYSVWENCPRDTETAIKWAEKAAEAGSIEGMLISAHILNINGAASSVIGDPEGALDEFIKAKYWIETAVQNNFNPAKAAGEMNSICNQLGECYFVLHRYAEAVECYKKTNKHDAAINLGRGLTRTEDVHGTI